MGIYADGNWGYFAGSAGTVTLPSGARLTGIRCHATAAGTVVIFNGQSIPVIAGTSLAIDIRHDLAEARKDAANVLQNTIVFTGTDSFYVDFIKGRQQ